MNHPWCSNPARDEAVRAAEDNRQGPLPTLEEAIATARAMMPKSVSGSSAPEQENKGNGMRTERVTLSGDDLLAMIRDAVAPITAERDSLRARVTALENAAKLAPAANAGGEVE